MNVTERCGESCEPTFVTEVGEVVNLTEVEKL